MMAQTTASTWVNRLVTGLFTAAAAWASVTVEIKRTVDARAEIAERRMEAVIVDRLDAAVRQLAKAQTRAMDSIAVACTKPQPGPATKIVVQAPRDTVAERRQGEVLDRMDRVEERLHFVAVALVQLRDQQKTRPPRRF